MCGPCDDEIGFKSEEISLILGSHGFSQDEIDRILTEEFVKTFPDDTILDPEDVSEKAKNFLKNS